MECFFYLSWLVKSIINSNLSQWIFCASRLISAVLKSRKLHEMGFCKVDANRIWRWFEMWLHSDFWPDDLSAHSEFLSVFFLSFTTQSMMDKGVKRTIGVDPESVGLKQFPLRQKPNMHSKMFHQIIVENGFSCTPFQKHTLFLWW